MIARASDGQPAPPSFKVVLYSHDTIGLGNVRRTLLIADAIKQQYQDAAILIVTGSPVIQAFRIPDGVDYIKLPCLDRPDSEHYTPKFLNGNGQEVSRIRRAILQQSIVGFGPDLMIVDKRAGGIDGELLDTLRALQHPHDTKLVLGIRDILDDPETTRLSLKRHRDMAIAARWYDEVWIYGSPLVFDTVKEYGFPAEVARKTYYCGYLKRASQPIGVHDGPPRILVTTGGGGDGADLIEAYLEGLCDLPRRIALRTTVVFGPQMTAARRAGLIERFGTLADVEFVDFEPDLTPRYAAADLVVSMAGYNTVCELLSFGQRAVLVPRGEPVREQLLRARLLAARGYFDLIEPPDLRPDRLMTTVLAALSRPRPTLPSVDLDGLPRICERVHHLLSGVCV